MALGVRGLGLQELSISGDGLVDAALLEEQVATDESLLCASLHLHDEKDGRPDGHIGEVPRIGFEPSAHRARIESLEWIRAHPIVDRANRQIENGYRQQ